MQPQALMEPARSLLSFIPDLASRGASALRRDASQETESQNPAVASTQQGHAVEPQCTDMCDPKDVCERSRTMKPATKENGIRIQAHTPENGPLAPDMPLLAAAYCHTGYIRLATRRERNRTR